MKNTFCFDKDSNTVGERLQTFRKNKGLSLRDACDRLEKYGIFVTFPTIGKWERGESTPNPYQLFALCDMYGIETIADLSGISGLNEAGMRKLMEYRQDLIDTGKYEAAPPRREIITIDMPVSFLAASAGTGNFLDDENFETISVPRESIPAGAEFGIRVSGDSMEPIFHDDQIVWVKPCSELKNGDVGIFLLNGCGYIKMYTELIPLHPEEYTDSEGVVHNQPVLVSYNRKYQPINVRRTDDLQIVGKVL